MDFQAAQPVTMCTSKVALAAGTTTTLSSTGTILYSIKGKAYSKSALSNTATPTTDANSGNAFTAVQANQGCVFLVGLDHSGNLKVAQGSVQALDSSGKFINAPQFGAIPSDFCPIGYIVIQVGSTGSAWTFGGSNLSGATGLTYTFVDLMGLPDRPQVS
jgi:hypothetical protein